MSLCPYCDFVVVAGAAARGPRNPLGAFVAALAARVGLRAEALDAALGRVTPPRRPTPRLGSARSPGRAPLASVYLGGGTPSLLPRRRSPRYRAVRARFGLADGGEVTLEANPGPDERGDLAGFAGRASLGSRWAPRALTTRNCGCSDDDIEPGTSPPRSPRREAAGIAQVNLDLLYDLPGQPWPTWKGRMEAALEMAPDHLSLYALTLDDPDAEGLTGPPGTTCRRLRAPALA